VGNKSIEQGFVISKQNIDLTLELHDKLNKFFLEKFEQVFEFYQFYHQSSMSFHQLYNYIETFYNGSISFKELTQKIAALLYECSTHPKIKPGELYICNFKNVVFHDKEVEAIGIYKTEDKKGYLDINYQQESYKLRFKEGVDINKFDKGCLIFKDIENGNYTIAIIDNQNRSEEAQYWKELFLGVEPINNDYHQTNQFLKLTKNYVTKQLTEEFEVSKTDQIDILNRSVEYFKSHEKFDKEEFETEVLYHPNIIESFQKYNTDYRETHEVTIDDIFDISNPAVKKQAKVFKSVLKLDKNFHIYIHGNKDMIEKGVEDNGRKYYKIYYNEEA
jgi:hypothetical protein